jgi:hypothetical protein
MIRSLREGDYLTDQQRLFRVLEIVATRMRRRTVILEDCRSLEVTLLKPRELRRMRLQAVRPTPRPRRPTRRRISVSDSSPTSSAPWTTSARRTSV